MNFKKFTIIQTALLASLLLAGACGKEEDKPEENSVSCSPADASTLTTTTTATGQYTVVDTNQTTCYDSTTGVADSVCSGTGYDADYTGNAPSYTDNSDGTITDDNTNLMWTQTADLNGDGNIDVDDKLSQSESVSYCEDLSLAGYDDWRLPDVKTLYSLMDFTGGDPSGYTGTDTGALSPFLPSVFEPAFGDQDAGERIIDGQYATTSIYVSCTNLGTGDATTMFGVNFVDGRIKGYPTDNKTYYVECVRNNTDYGLNNFTDNSDGTITDNATGLMWEQDDHQSTDFEDAVSICESATTGGYSDWRLPDIKELQSILDYSRSPDTTNSAAINSVFNSTSFTNEGGETDYGFYWSSTTHATYDGDGHSGAYISFGRALGYISDAIRDVHGAGAQRSNYKQDVASQAVGSDSGTGTAYDSSTFYYHGPQGDILRLDNMVRCVR